METFTTESSSKFYIKLVLYKKFPIIYEDYPYSFFKANIMIAVTRILFRSKNKI